MKGVYVLQLESGKLYVGYSDDMEKRIKQHFSGNGSQWTKKHIPTKVLSRHTNATLKDEQLITKALMGTHGVNNVRGGGYTQTTKTYSKKTSNSIRKGSSAFCKQKTLKDEWCKASPITGTNYCMFHTKGAKK